MLSANEWFTLTWITCAAIAAGATFVAITPRSWPVVVSALIGAPCVAAVVLVTIMFVLGIISGLQAGWGIGATLGSGLAAGALYGFGATIFGTPGALLGGGLGAIIRHYRLRT